MRKCMHMSEIESRMRAQLAVIEQVYSIEIQNKGEIIRLTSDSIDNPKQVLMICTSLNMWIANNNKQGTIVIPQEIILSAMERLH